MVFCNLTIPISNPSVLDNQFPQSREQEAVQVTLHMHMIVFKRTIMCSALVIMRLESLYATRRIISSPPKNRTSIWTTRGTKRRKCQPWSCSTSITFNYQEPSMRLYSRVLQTQNFGNKIHISDVKTFLLSMNAAVFL